MEWGGGVRAGVLTAATWKLDQGTRIWNKMEMTFSRSLNTEIIGKAIEGDTGDEVSFNERLSSA